MKAALKRLMARLAAWQPMRSAVLHLVYPNIVRAMLAEVQPDTQSPSGVVEAWAWKIHSHILRSEEMADGKNCAGDAMRCDAETRRRVLDVVGQHLAVLVEERPYRRQQAVDLLQRVGQVAIGAGQELGRAHV